LQRLQRFRHSVMQDVSSDDDPPPEPPVRPSLDECCKSACDPCIFDMYEDALDRYRVALAAWRARHPDVPANDD